MKNGLIQLSWGLAMAAVSFIAAPLVGYFSAQMATETRIGVIDKEVGIQKNRIDNLQEKVNETNNKVIEIQNGINALLLKQGIDPNKIQTKK